MKVMDLQCITHCTDDDYQLITIHGADDTLIHIKPSKTLRKQLIKQNNKAKSIKTGVVLKHKNVSSIEEYNIGDRLKYSRIKQSSKKDIEESRINVKYQEHYRSIWNSAKCKMQSAKYNVQSAKYNVQSAKYKVQSAKCKVQYRNFWNNAKY